VYSQTEEDFFFLERKKQRTFVFQRDGAPPPLPMNKSLFASFSPEKEGLYPFVAPAVSPAM
jgi:hypothetical protein